MQPWAEIRVESAADAGGGARVPLTKREREILGLLAEGLSGAQIAGELVLSPETVRTHVRNAMAKLGASTRSQAVALALKGNEISPETFAAPATERPARRAEDAPAVDPTPGLAAMITGLVGLYDVDGGGVYLAEEDGLSLRRVATASGAEGEVSFDDVVALGDGPLGRAALERRAQLLHDRGSGSRNPGALIAAPMVGGGRLLGVIALRPRSSRPIGRSEMLLLQAFANRVAEVVLDGSDVEDRLARAMDRFSASWSAGPRMG
jgi:DNA-binding CsgD family transcriptional regulator